MLGPTLVRREPVGVVGAIVPWNVPLFVTMLKLGPALASGSTVVLKPAPETPLDAYLLAEIAAGGRAPPRACSTSCRPVARSASTSCTHPDVDKISFTGSRCRGPQDRCALRRAAQALHARARRQVGGDHPRRRRLSTTIAGLMPNAIDEQRRGVRGADAHPRLARRGTTRSSTRWPRRCRRCKVGDPLDPETAVGPLFASRHRDRVEGYIAKGKEEGARLVTGGGRPAGLAKGWYVEPTLFADVDNQHDDRPGGDLRPGARRHPLRRRRRRASRIANDSDYGLSGSVWTADPQAGVDVARRVRTGTYGINGMGMDFASPVRRLQAVGDRPRAGARGARRVPRAEDHRAAAGFRTCLISCRTPCGSTSPTSHPRECARSRSTSTSRQGSCVARWCAAACPVEGCRAGTSTSRPPPRVGQLQHGAAPGRPWLRGRHRRSAGSGGERHSPTTATRSRPTSWPTSTPFAIDQVLAVAGCAPRSASVTRPVRCSPSCSRPVIEPTTRSDCSASAMAAIRGSSCAPRSWKREPRPTTSALRIVELTRERFGDPLPGGGSTATSEFLLGGMAVPARARRARFGEDARCSRWSGSRR